MVSKRKPFDIDHLPYYIVEKFDQSHRMIVEGRYWNCNYSQIGIVATITYHREVDRGDWAAYIWACKDGYPPSEQLFCREVAEKGAKLSEKDARYFFPAITLPYRQ